MVESVISRPDASPNLAGNSGTFRPALESRSGCGVIMAMPTRRITPPYGPAPPPLFTVEEMEAWVPVILAAKVSPVTLHDGSDGRSVVIRHNEGGRNWNIVMVKE
jgi:hypothetical protein